MSSQTVSSQTTPSHTVPSPTAPPRYRNCFSAALFTFALAGYTQLASQPITTPLSIALPATAASMISESFASEPVTHSAQFMSCEGIQPLLCAYINRELVNRLNLQLWSTPAANQPQPSAETITPPTSSHFGQTIKFLTACKNWIEAHAGLLETPHNWQPEQSIALSVEE